MAQPFLNHAPGITAPAIGPLAITPNDSTDLAHDIRSITINAAGTISTVGWDGVTYTSNTLPAGTYPCFARRIRATGTTATGITGWI